MELPTPELYMIPHNIREQIYDVYNNFSDNSSETYFRVISDTDCITFKEAFDYFNIDLKLYGDMGNDVMSSDVLKRQIVNKDETCVTFTYTDSERINYIVINSYSDKKLSIYDSYSLNIYDNTIYYSPYTIYSDGRYFNDNYGSELPKWCDY